MVRWAQANIPILYTEMGEHFSVFFVVALKKSYRKKLQRYPHGVVYNCNNYLTCYYYNGKMRVGQLKCVMRNQLGERERERERELSNRRRRCTIKTFSTPTLGFVSVTLATRLLTSDGKRERCVYSSRLK